MRYFHPIWFALFGLVSGMQAHPLLQDAMWVLFEPHQVRVAVEVSLREISVAQNFASGAGNITDPATLNRAAEQHGDYVLKHLTLSAGKTMLAGKVVKMTPPSLIAGPEQTFFQYELVYPLNASPPAEITFLNDMLKEWPYAMGTAWDLNYVVRAKNSDATEATSWLLGYRQPATIPTGWTNPSPAEPASVAGWRTFRGYFWHGVWHILTGYDHLLFVSALVIATTSFWEMVRVIAAFTLAHTVTLTLCVFGLFRLPSSVVEPVIALSIVFVAVENLVRPSRARSRFRLAVAFGFGLVHGLGFAGGLLDAMAGLPAAGVWIALGAFSLGVETGHQIVVLPFFGLLMANRRRRPAAFQPPLLRYGSAVISGCGAYYLCMALYVQVFSR